MSVSTNQNFELTTDQLCRRAYQLAGLLEAGQVVQANDLALAHDLLGMELDALQADGVVLRTVERTTLALTSTTNPEYTLPAATIDVYVGNDNVAGTIVPTQGNETLVRAISRQEYLQISNKLSNATPSLVYIEKQGTTKVCFWPVPAVTNSSFRYNRIRLPYDSEGSKTLDLARRWQKAICYMLAWQLALAKSLPADRVSMLRSVGEEAKAKAVAGDIESTSIQMYAMRYN